MTEVRAKGSREEVSRRRARVELSTV